jgi:hypothetical protein
MLRAGAQFDEELKRAFGAFGGALDAAGKSVGKLAAGDLEGLANNVPITAVKNIAGAVSYAQYGDVLNKRGQVVIEDPGMVDIFARAVGFYPEQFMRVNEQVRREEYTRAFVKEVKNKFTEKYRRAAIANDYTEMRELEAAVREHNIQFRGTALAFGDTFTSNLKRAAAEAKLPLAERYKKSLPKTQQEDAVLD